MSLPSSPQPNTNEITFAVAPSRHVSSAPADPTEVAVPPLDCRCCCSARTARSPSRSWLRRGRPDERMEAGSDAPGARR